MLGGVSHLILSLPILDAFYSLAVSSISSILVERIEGRNAVSQDLFGQN